MVQDSGVGNLRETFGQQFFCGLNFKYRFLYILTVFCGKVKIRQLELTQSPTFMIELSMQDDYVSYEVDKGAASSWL